MVARDHFLGRHYDAVHSTGPFRSLNPTRRYLVADQKPVSKKKQDESTQEKPTEPAAAAVLKAAYVWRSRDNRKGRHAVVVDGDPRKHGSAKAPRLSNTWRQTLRGVAKMFLRFPVWDVSYDVAVVFTIGSVIWVFNGFFSWLPVEDPSSEFSGETTWAAGLTALVGATVFEFGSVLLMLEAVNENRADCFGWAVEESVDGVLRLHKEDHHACRHSHARKSSFVGGGKSSSNDEADDGLVHTQTARTWSWWPTWYELKTHYFKEVGFLACLSQMTGATIFWIAGITALPPILNGLDTAATNGVYWLPQVVGGAGFIVSSALFMIEVQPRWYVPAPGVLGWHIGLWNLVGAIGFTLCGALGFGIDQPAVEYAATLSTYIGSWAFLIGSAIQWFESLNKYPIWVDDKVGSLTTTS